MVNSCSSQLAVFQGKNEEHSELKLCIILQEGMRTSKRGFAIHAISRKISLQVCLCADIVEIQIMLCWKKEELTDSRDFQSILMFHNCASLCRTALELLKSLH